jgi:transcriptional/translational regulatory protein YebC/TACO1
MTQAAASGSRTIAVAQTTMDLNELLDKVEHTDDVDFVA